MTIADTLTDATKTVQDWSLSALKSSDEVVVDAAKKISGALEPVASRVRTSPVVEQLPRPQEVVERLFGYAEKLLAEEKRFSLDLANTLRPQDRPQPKSTRRSGGTTKAG